jgi:exonuclease III
MRAFNNYIENSNLREIHRVAARFTWTNMQENPVQSNIDRVLVTTRWEHKFPLSSLNSLTRVGSDHCPMILDIGVDMGSK